LRQALLLDKNELACDLSNDYDHKYTCNQPGHNLKIAILQAAFALAHMARFEEFIENRCANLAYLKSKLDSVADFLHSRN
jgi:dTDP-4-amino-4,6-dideoxygalactose transaminase